MAAAMVKTKTPGVFKRGSRYVVVYYDPSGLVKTLRGLGIRVLVQDAAKTLDGAYAQMLELGRITGHLDSASRLVSSMKARIKALVARGAPRARGLTVYH